MSSLCYLLIYYLTFVNCLDCESNEFKCADEEYGIICISKYWVCDGYLDCYDRSDEDNCNASHPTPLVSIETITTTTSLLSSSFVPISQSSSPSQNSDALTSSTTIFSPTVSSTTTNTSTATTATTASTTITSTSATTTTATTTTATTTTPTTTTYVVVVPVSASSTVSTHNITTENVPCSFVNSTRCHNTEECIPTNYWCDGVVDCPDGSDEMSCGIICVGANETLCPNGECRVTSVYCTALNACYSHKDELYCTNATTHITFKKNINSATPQPACQVGNEFTCNNGNCIPDNWKCDGVDDCFDYSDEVNCPPGMCPTNYFNCRTSNTCIGSWQVCNRISDCIDNSDEANCSYNRRPSAVIKLVSANLYWLLRQSCKDEEFKCDSASDNSMCMPLSWKCDGVVDCRDKSDELSCPINKTCHQSWRRSKVFQCWDNNDQCVNPTLRCNDNKECSDGSDEIGCYCDDSKSNVRCLSYQCVSSTAWCDGIPQCQDNTDEDYCNMTQCLDSSFRCESLKKCLPLSYKCNGVVDCPDGSDEFHCPCPISSGFVCEAGGTCINYGSFCDGIRDCPNGFDEPSDCATKCAPNLFQCKIDGRCIHPSSVCDTIADCPDASDEYGCPVEGENVALEPANNLS